MYQQEISKTSLLRRRGARDRDRDRERERERGKGLNAVGIGWKDAKAIA